ncbi:hypothetical protein INR49_010690 [Caranx melampygus]|nr:hypothetical protein INR49_010690 [Caranx melampygus]
MFLIPLLYYAAPHQTPLALMDKSVPGRGADCSELTISAGDPSSLHLLGLWKLLRTDRREGGTIAPPGVASVSLLCSPDFSPTLLQYEIVVRQIKNSRRGERLLAAYDDTSVCKRKTCSPFISRPQPLSPKSEHRKGVTWKHPHPTFLCPEQGKVWPKPRAVLH